MQVVYTGNDPLVLTEYNGKRYVFRKNIPVEIDPKIYNEIVLSRHVTASEVVPCEIEKKEKEVVVEKIKGRGKK